MTTEKNNAATPDGAALELRRLAELAGKNAPWVDTPELADLGPLTALITEARAVYAAGGAAAFIPWVQAMPQAARLLSGDPGARLRVWTADAILSTAFAEPVWAVPELMPTGLTILAGKPKAGKSWLALQIAQAVATGGRVLGQVVEKGAVLYLALEDPPRRLKKRMTAQHWPTGTHADFLTLGDFADQLGALNANGCGRLAAAIESEKYRFVVIDTLSRAFLGDQLDVAEMTRALTPIQEAAHKHAAAILVIDHHRKGGFGEADAIGDILGSTAKGAMADTAWGLYRERGKAGARLQVVGRDVTEQTLALNFDPVTSAWQCDGDAGALAMTEAREDILAVLEAASEPLGTTEIARAVGVDKGNTYRRLQDLATAGLIVKRGKGYVIA